MFYLKVSPIFDIWLHPGCKRVLKYLNRNDIIKFFFLLFSTRTHKTLSSNGDKVMITQNLHFFTQSSVFCARFKRLCEFPQQFYGACKNILLHVRASCVRLEPWTRGCNQGPNGNGMERHHLAWKKMTPSFSRATGGTDVRFSKEFTLQTKFYANKAAKTKGGTTVWWVNRRTDCIEKLNYS